MSGFYFSPANQAHNEVLHTAIRELENMTMAMMAAYQALRWFKPLKSSSFSASTPRAESRIITPNAPADSLRQ